LLVDGPPFSFRKNEKEQGFDKLSPQALVTSKVRIEETNLVPGSFTGSTARAPCPRRPIG
jgi:hypothetical protein